MRGKRPHKFRQRTLTMPCPWPPQSPMRGPSHGNDHTLEVHLGAEVAGPKQANGIASVKHHLSEVGRPYIILFAVLCFFCLTSSKVPARGRAALRAGADLAHTTRRQVPSQGTKNRNVLNRFGDVLSNNRNTNPTEMVSLSDDPPELDKQRSRNANKT